MSKARDIVKTIGINTGDETVTTIKTALGITTLSGSNTGDQTIPTTLPASDVYAWAKAATKPTYTYTEVGAQVAGTYATGTGSATGTNTGDQTTITGNAGTATSLTGGVLGSIPYQSATSTTAMTAAGTTGQVLTTVTTGNAPTWQTPTGGTVTSVAALTLGTTGTDLSSTVATGTTTPVITLNVPTASASNRGVLSSTDWSTFNNKQPAGSYLTSAVTTFSAGSTGLTPNSATSGAVTLAGTLSIANGGTGQTTNGAAYTSLVGYTTIATAGGNTVLDNNSENLYYFTGTLNQTITLPVVTTLLLGWSFDITNNSTGLLTINSSGGNLVLTISSGMTAMVTCVDVATNTTATAWDYGYTDFTTLTGTGSNVLANTPTLTALTLAAGGTAAGSAPLKITPSANVLTTPESGAFEVDSTNTVAYFTGNTTNGRALIPATNMFRLTADLAATATTISPFFGTSSSIPLVANGVYEIEMQCYFQKSTAGTLVWTITNSAVVTNMQVVIEHTPVAGYSAVPTASAITMAALTGQTAAATAFTATASLTNNTNHWVRIKIILENASSTSLRLNVTNSAGSVTPRRGSYWKSTRIANAGILAT